MRMGVFVVRVAAAVLLGAMSGVAQVNIGSLADDGWYSDDTRADGSGTQPAGTNLVSPLLTDNPEATASGNPAHDADIFRQIQLGAAPGVVPAGTWGGALHLSISTLGGASGKTQISHRKDDLTGHAPGSVLAPGFTAQYSWMANGAAGMTPSLKFGIKTAEFGSTPVSSRTGENAWDKVLIYEPGNGNGGTPDGLWHTETINFTTGNWWFFDRKAGAGTISHFETLSAMAGDTFAFSGAKTVAQVYALITAPGARITSVQFGIGSANPGANVYVNQLQTSAYLGGQKITFGAPALACDQNVTNNVIFGSGNTNGSYTVARASGVEIGLRGKLRFDAANQPQNVYNSNGDTTYSFEAGAPTRGAPWVTAATPFWNVDWSVNSNYDGSSGLNLSGLTYEIGMDFDPGPGTNYLVFDPIGAPSTLPFAPPFSMPFWDNSLGTNATAQGAGVEASSQANYLTLLGSNNLAQNSWSMEFFNEAPFNTFNPQVQGRYEFYLAAKSGGNEVARSRITIVVNAPVDYDQNATPNQIQGAGVTNGSYTAARLDGLEIGMRGKLRYLLGVPANIYNSNGDGTYTFNTGTGGGPAGNSEWSFEWAVNTDYDNSHSTREVGDLTYEIGMDNDPGPGTNYLKFDPISIGTIIPYTVPVGPIPFWDHAMGDNTTPMSGGLVAANGATYAAYLALYNVAQQSWKPTFYQNTLPYSWNPNVVGRYEYYLAAKSGGTELARSAITIIATNGASLLLEATPCQRDQDCNLPGNQIEVRVYGRNYTAVSGYQAFLGFDATKLTYVGAASSYSASPFPTHVQSIATANVSVGKLRLDGAVSFGGLPVADDALLATLVFTAASECTPTAITFDPPTPFPSQLSLAGVPVTTATVDSGSIVVDATPPVLVQSPNLTVAAEADTGCGSAVVTWPTPAATDNCGGVTVACYPPSGTTFPSNTTTPVTCVATDTCGNTATRTFNVTVTPTNKVQLSVQLVGVVGPVTRCIHFQTNGCSGVTDVQLNFNASGLFTGEIEVPCGTWTSLCAKDRQHTKWTSSLLGLNFDGTKYVASSTISLVAGDTDDDGDVDIHDVTWFIDQFGDLTVSGGCPYNGTSRDADFSDNGAVGSEDYSFLVAAWLTSSSCACAPLTYEGDGPGFSVRSSMAVGDPAGAAADLNSDGLVDYRDVQVFESRNGLSGELSAAMHASFMSGH